jgi:hypothetical protein
MKILLLVQVAINQVSINVGYGGHTLDRKTPKQSLGFHTSDR